MMRVAMMMSVWILVVIGTIAKVVYKSNSLASIDWKQIPKNNEQISHTWKLKRDGSVELLAHSRSLTTCKDNTKMGFVKNMTPTQIVPSRKLKQLFSEDVPDLQTIIGADDRIRSPNTLKYPYSTVGLLRFKDSQTGSDGQCTGTMISSSALITSAHCIWGFQKSQSNTDIQFYPARDGNYVPLTAQIWQNIFIPNKWTQDFNTDYDYAVVQLRQPIGEIVGKLNIRQPCSAVDPTDTLYLLGYLGDKAFQQWYVSCNVEVAFDTCNATTFLHTCDTLGGSSGGVLWNIVDGLGAQIQGVHQGFADKNLNQAIAINQDAYDFITRNI